MRSSATETQLRQHFCERPRWQLQAQPYRTEALADLPSDTSGGGGKVDVVMERDILLLTQRQEVALSSGGRSTDAVYLAVARELEAEKVSGSALDFGAGKGLGTRLLVDSGRFNRIVAADLIEYDPALPAEAVIGDLNKPLGLSDASFDLVLAIGILEYLENPFLTCREWARLLKPTGLLIGTIPNVESLRSLIALIFRGHFAGFASTSLSQLPLTRATLTNALTAAGFVPPRWFFSDRGTLPIPSTQLTWQQASLGLLRGLRFSNAVGFVTRL